MNIIIEGTDGVGKSTTIERLKEITSHSFHDRDRNVISANMLFGISMEDRVKAYDEFLSANDVRVVFLVNNDSSELMRRITTRAKKISDFDMDAPKYNQLYIDTFNVMKSRDMLHGKICMVDVTGMTLDQQVSAVNDAINDLV